MQSNMKNPARNQPLRRRLKAGFSLVEMLIVIALIAIVGTLLIGRIGNLFGGAQEDVAKQFVENALKAPLLKYRIDTGSYPSTEAGLEDSDSRLEVLFEQILPERGLFRSNTRETAEIPAVTFRPDRSSTPFQVSIDYGSNDFTQRFDPFSDIVIYDSRSD